MTTPSPQQILGQIATGHIVASALQTVLALGIPDRLVQGPVAVATLAKDVAANEDALYRVLRALASVGLFTENAPRSFALTSLGRALVKGPGSFHDMALWITSPFHFRTYADMLHAVKTGKPAVDHVFGKPVFDYLAQDPALQTVFNNAMTGFSADAIPAVLEAYDFSGIGTLVDVAGGHGMVLTSILRRYPAMKGILFDMAHVVAGAEPVIAAAGVADRCRRESGDFFKAVPAGDAYVMKHIIHDWDDERAALILRNIKAAMTDPADGRVILLEGVIKPGDAPDFAKVLDLEMLMMPGGRERTETEFRELFARAGFALSRIVPTAGPLCVIEARPN